MPDTDTMIRENAALRLRLARQDMMQVRLALIATGKLDSLVERIATWEYAVGDAEKVLRREPDA